jgi:hypothetical protein
MPAWTRQRISDLAINPPKARAFDKHRGKHHFAGMQHDSRCADLRAALAPAS